MAAGCKSDDPGPSAAEQAAGLATGLGTGAAVDETDLTKVNVTGEIEITGTVTVGAGVTLALSSDAELAGDGKIVLAGDLVDSRTGTSGYFGAVAGDTFTIEVRAGATLTTKDSSADRPLFGAPSDEEENTTPYFQLEGNDKVELVGNGESVTIKIAAGTVDLNRPQADKSWTASEDLPLEIAAGATLVVKAGNLNIDNDALKVNGTLEISGGTHLARPAALFTNGSTGKIKVYHGGSIVRLYGTTGGNTRASLVAGGPWATADDDKNASYFVWGDTATSGTDFITFDLGTNKDITISDGSKIKLHKPADAGSTASWLSPLEFNSALTGLAPTTGKYVFKSLTVTSGVLVGDGTTPTLKIGTGGSVTSLITNAAAVTATGTYTWSSTWSRTGD
ncbi:MAG: hypothetical protein LBS64_00015 [Spirochaetaceae bacterium]|nr:hypothetical protein [Spirochaetaceae bacterium]